jgi:hypothetical protein
MEKLLTGIQSLEKLREGNFLNMVKKKQLYQLIAFCKSQ